jgi:translation initiation factor 1 (eIF-1/SUI1)
MPNVFVFGPENLSKIDSNILKKNVNIEDNEDIEDIEDNEDNKDKNEENKDKKEDSKSESESDSETRESNLKSNSKSDKKSKNKTNIEIKTSEINSPFSPFSQVSSFNSPFSTSDISNNFDFENPKTEFDEQIENLIDIYKVINRKRANHYNTIVKGLSYLEKDKLKTVMSKIKKSLGIGGAEINSEDIDPDNKVILFQGDFAKKIKDILVKELKRDEYYFNIHE